MRLSLLEQRARGFVLIEGKNCRALGRGELIKQFLVGKISPHSSIILTFIRNSRNGNLSQSILIKKQRDVLYTWVLRRMFM